VQVYPQITFHDIERSSWVEDYVAERLRKLDRYAEGITSCHVTLAREQSKHHKGNRYSVMVEVRIPPHHDLAVKKQKEIRHIQNELPALINLAFGAIERQLKRTAALRRGEPELRRLDGQPHGMIDKLFAEGYGFIRSLNDNRQYYFHRNSVLHGDFDRLTVGTEVRFSPEEGDQGAQASSVQVVSRRGAGT
jgi:cold shock CspA family protein/ribosome-associated translation inhibitor RaiA